ncbi:hypothetical protein B0A48_12779 [Cryoendolithus antarcticus]|uniref:C2H2-type domain-containing protein n=1 Tax=Cryoendolithus antarcticus TaxID=1507870 RepID=A0A1V8SS69_9PEZI|nr:hypothetical protein B0A48_12779 [Cryoendolithus antarcticus]
MDFLRERTNSNLSVYSAANPVGIRKRSASRSPSISAAQVHRLEQLCLNQSTAQDLDAFTNNVTNYQWLTPQPSPQSQPYLVPCSIEAFPQWTAPTPPRSDSEVSTLAIDAQDEIATTTAGESQSFGFDPVTTTAEMSSLGYLLPSQYATNMYDATGSDYSNNSSYSSMRSQPMIMASMDPYSHALSSSPALYQSRPVAPSYRRHSGVPIASSTDSSYSSSYRRVSSPYDAVTSSEYSMPMNQTIPSIAGLTQSPLPSPHLGMQTSAATYNQNLSRTSTLYETTSMYSQPFTNAPTMPQSYATTPAMSYKTPFVASSMNEVSPKLPQEDPSIRVLNQRPKPQCFEHGCNGRQFSTFSNLLRHQREKSGTASKSYCPKCGAEFTRTTARNGHLAHDKCTKPGQVLDDALE